MGKKSALAVLAAAAATVVGLLLLARGSFEAPGLGKTVLRKAREATGIVLDSSRAKFGPLEGLVLEEVTASNDFALGRYQARLDAVRFRHVPLSLLRGRLEVTRIVLERPRVVVEIGRPSAEGAAPPVPPLPQGRERTEETEPYPGAGLIGLDLSPSQLLLEEGSFAIRDLRRGRNLLSLDGLRLELPQLAYDRRALSPLHALASRGEVAASALTVGDLRLTGLEAAISTGAGRLRFERLRFQSDEGDFEGDADVDFNSIPFRYRMSLTAASLELGRLARSLSGAMGKGLLRLQGEGFGTDSRHLKARGTLELGSGRLPAAAWISQIDGSLPGAGYEATAVPFEVKGGRVSFEGLTLAAGSSALVVAGSIGFDEQVDLEIDARVGDREISYRLRGKLEQPELTRRD
jgi:hypothetical protein